VSVVGASYCFGEPAASDSLRAVKPFSHRNSDVPPERKHIRVVESDGHTVVRFNNVETLFLREDTLREVREEWDSLGVGNLVVPENY
jgi:hypothetical protein